MNADTFRRLMLEVSGASEGCHMGHADFRIGGKIFASLSPNEDFGVLSLTPETQGEMMNRHPEQFSPMAGGWGMRGWTRVHLEHARVPAVRQAVARALAKVVGSKRRTNSG